MFIAEGPGVMSEIGMTVSSPGNFKVSRSTPSRLRSISLFPQLVQRCHGTRPISCVVSMFPIFYSHCDSGFMVGVITVLSSCANQMLVQTRVRQRCSDDQCSRVTSYSASPSTLVSLAAATRTPPHFLCRCGVACLGWMLLVLSRRPQ